VRNWRAGLPVVVAVALACWAGLMVRDHRRLADDIAAFKAGSAQTLSPSFNCRSHEDQGGQSSHGDGSGQTLLLCGSTTMYFASDKRDWLTFGVVAVLALTLASLPLIRARRPPA
jgi:hypothetical protein